MSSTTAETIWNLLQQHYPWPEQRPACEPIPWNLDYGGRALVTQLIRERGVKVVLEIGVFLGGSVRKWLQASPEVVVIAVDGWQQHYHYFQRHATGAAREQLLQDEGFFNTFVANMWDVRDRVVPVRGDSVTMLHDLHALGVQPDLVYIDTDKSGREIAVCGQLFPNAIITGDDWYWGGDQGFPIRAPVLDACRDRKRHLKKIAMTWAIDDRPFTLTERAKNLYYVPHEIGLTFYGLYHRVRGMREAKPTSAH